MVVKIAFYKGKGTWIDKCIRWWTDSKYSHTEVVVGPKWYSSSTRDGGVRCKRIILNNEHWDYLLVDISPSRVQEVFKEEYGKTYNYLGIISTHVLGIPYKHKDTWFCSEYCAYTLDIDNPIKYTPESLYKYLSKD